MTANLKAQIEAAHKALLIAEEESRSAAMEALDALHLSELTRSSEKEDIFKKAAKRYLTKSERYRIAGEQQRDVLATLHERLTAAMAQP